VHCASGARRRSVLCLMPPAVPCCPLLQVTIAEAGAIPLLVALLRSPKDATRKAAASGGCMEAPGGWQMQVLDAGSQHSPAGVCTPPGCHLLCGIQKPACCVMRTAAAAAAAAVMKPRPCFFFY